MKSKLLTLALISSSIMLKAQLPQNIDLSTGVINGSTSLAAIGSVDDTWSVAIPGGSTFQNAIVSNGSLAGTSSTYLSGSCGQWISPFTITAAGSDFGKIDAPSASVAGTYLYRTTFDWFSCNNAYPVLNVALAGADNQLVELIINGYAYDLTSYNISFVSLKTFSFPIPAYQLNSGQNVIILAVNNVQTYTGLYLCANLRLSPDITPSIAGPSSFCLGSALTFTGSAASSTVSNHYWEIAESTSSGAIVSGGLNWNNWHSGVPGVFTFPSNLGISCGKYYKIKLATQNACTSWSETSKVIYIKCLPTANAGQDVSICSGSCTDIGVSGIPGHSFSYQWNDPSGIIGTGMTVNVCPSTTTTYTFTVTNNTTGCSASDYVTVNVINNDPSFSLYINTTNSSYFTVQATANNLNAYSVTGFYYDLQIQEMNGTTPYYTNGGTDAWWTYPTHEYKGFVSTGTGTFTQTAWWQTTPPPTTGVFLYGHTYKLSRTTWNDYCPQQTFYTIITPVKSPITGNTTMVAIPQGSPIPEGTDASVFAAIQEQANVNTVSIYPNPGNGIFSIVMDTDAEASIEIYDILGQKVKSFEHSGLKSGFDLTGSPKGMYIINIISEGKKSSKKIILE